MADCSELKDTKSLHPLHLGEEVFQVLSRASSEEGRKIHLKSLLPVLTSLFFSRKRLIMWRDSVDGALFPLLQSRGKNGKSPKLDHIFTLL